MSHASGMSIVHANNEHIQNFMSLNKHKLLKPKVIFSSLAKLLLHSKSIFMTSCCYYTIKQFNFEFKYEHL